MKHTNKINRHNSIASRLSRIFSLLVCLMFVLTVFAVPALAAGEEGENALDKSNIVTGFKALLADATNVLVVLCPIIGGLFAVYYLIRRSMSDDQDGKMWLRKVYWAVGCGVGGGLVAGIVTLISGYF